MEKKTLKVILLGDSNVGKTSIIRRYTKNDFSVSTMATVSGGVAAKEIEISKTKVELQIWDTAGQERFSSLSRLFFRNCHACVIVFDLSQPMTFESVVKWKRLFVEYGAYEQGKLPPIFLVGNKLDLKKSSKVNEYDMGQVISKENFIEEKIRISASKGGEIPELFKNVATHAYNYEKNLNNPDDGERKTLNQYKENHEEKKGCCS